MEKDFTNHTSATLDADLENALKHIDLNLIIAILKYGTDATHPLSAGQLVLYMNSLSGKKYSERTLFRKLHYIHTILEKASDATRHAFALSHGGYVRVITSKGAAKEQNRYYFEPLLSPADSIMLQSAITSNRYVSKPEADYFSSVLQLLFPTQFCRSDSLTDYFPSVPKRPAKADHSQKYIDILGVVHTIHTAIMERLQISLVYGHYAISETIFEGIDFVPENKNEPYILNPFALFWHNGNYYLLATDKNSETPVHFRVDRIVDAAICTDASNHPVSRDYIPHTLERYFTKNGSHSDAFDAESYRSSHPQLVEDATESFIDCTLECHSDSLHLLIDTFGTTELLGRKIRIQKSDLIHTQHLNVPELYENRKEGTYFQVRIPNVERKNILSFCIHNHHLVTPVEPIDLVADAAVFVAASPNRHLDVINASLERALEQKAALSPDSLNQAATPSNNPNKN